MAAGLYGEPETIARHFLGAVARGRHPVHYGNRTQLTKGSRLYPCFGIIERNCGHSQWNVEAEVIMTLIDCFVAMGHMKKPNDASSALTKSRYRHRNDIYDGTSLCVQSEDSDAVRVMQERLNQLKSDTNFEIATLPRTIFSEKETGGSKICHESTTRNHSTSLDLLNTWVKFTFSRAIRRG